MCRSHMDVSLNSLNNNFPTQFQPIHPQFQTLSPNVECNKIELDTKTELQIGL